MVHSNLFLTGKSGSGSFVVVVLWLLDYSISDDQISRGNPHIRESCILAPVRPRMQAADLRCLMLQIAVAFPKPQARAFPGTKFSRSPKYLGVT